MSSLYSVQEEIKNLWDYSGEVGFIKKSSGNSEKDAEQDQNIEANKNQIEETKRSLRENESRDDEQQRQIDANSEAISRNDNVDMQQQSQIDANAEAISRNDNVDIQQQSQIDDTISRLNANIEDDLRQQNEINANRDNIIRVEGQLPTLDMDGTMLVIGTKGENP